MTTIGLVHGAYHGGWCWDRLVPELVDRGFDTVAPDLPCDDTTAGLLDYAAVVTAALEGHDDVVLVGHSLGSLTIPLVAVRRPVRRMIFLCSLPTPADTTAAETMGKVVRPDFLAAPRFVHDNRDLMAPGDARALFYHDCSDEDAWWAVAHLRPQSRRPIFEGWPLERWPDAATTVVLNEDDAVIECAGSAQMAKALTGEDPIILPGSHSPFLSRPAALAEVLAREARRPA